MPQKMFDRTTTLEEVIQMIEGQQDINEPIRHVLMRNNPTLLHLAAFYQQGEIVRYLLDHGADVDCRDGGNMTALHHAAGQGYVEVTGVLLAAGADASAKDQFQDSALHRAAKAGGYEADASNLVSTPLVAERLIEYGADVNAKGSHGNSPLHTLLGEAPTLRGDGGVRMLQVLVGHGADVNARNNFGSTPLGTALSSARNFDAAGRNHAMRLMSSLVALGGRPE